MIIKKKVIVRKIANETMLVPIGDTTGEFNGLFTLTDSAAIAFRVFQTGGEKEDAVKAILDEYDADENDVRLDVEEFIASLKEFGII